LTSGRAGQQVDDLCRQCKAVRRHTVVANDAEGEIARVMCDFCRSEHNFRGGGGVRTAPPRREEKDDGEVTEIQDEGTPANGIGTPATEPGTPATRTNDLERLLRKVLREEAGLTPATPAAKWRGGQLVLRPANTSLQEKSWPIDAFFHKIVMLRNRLRTLEQQVNASGLPEDEKVKLQAYVTACYGTLTSFNVLFADPADHFRGAGGD
jgi:hypothetical protein